MGVGKKQDPAPVLGRISRELLLKNFGNSSEPCVEVFGLRQEWALKRLAWDFEAAKCSIGSLPDKIACAMANSLFNDKLSSLNQGERETFVRDVFSRVRVTPAEFPMVRHALKRQDMHAFADFLASGLRRT